MDFDVQPLMIQNPHLNPNYNSQLCLNNTGLAVNHFGGPVAPDSLVFIYVMARAVLFRQSHF